MASVNPTRRAAALAGLIVAGVAAAGVNGAAAQEANLSFAATQPAKGRITWREQVRFTRYGLPDRDIDQLVVDTRLTLGLTGALSAWAELPVVSERDRSDGAPNNNGLGDVSLGLKWRFWQHDTGAIETKRLALFGGLSLPTGEDGLSSEGFDPFVGLVYTMVHGRHGLNASARYRVNTDGTDAPLGPIGPWMGSADLLTLETSYLFRISPASYASDTVGSLYGVVESFVDYETNGDTEWRLAPGLLWEARRWAAEVSVVLPAAADIEHRAETEFGLVAGIRVLF